MNMVKIKRVRENAVIPKRATDGSAGADLCACIDQPLTINPGELAKIPTGIARAWGFSFRAQRAWRKARNMPFKRSWRY